MTRIKKGFIALAVAFSVFAGIACLLTVKKPRAPQVREEAIKTPAPAKPSAPDVGKPDRDLSFSRYPSAESYPEVALLYFGLVDREPTADQYEKIARAQSPGFRRLSGNLAKADALARLKPEIQAQIRSYQSRHFSISKDLHLGSYNLDQQAFPILASMGMPDWYGWRLDDVRGGIDQKGIKIRATNQNRFTRVTVKDEGIARKLDSSSERERKCTARLYLYAEKITEEAFGIVIHVRIIRMEFFGHSGQLYATLDGGA